MSDPFVPPNRNLPDGIVTFLLTDVEDSSRLWEVAPEEMRLALRRHDALAQAAITAQGGILLKHRGEGDSLFAVFARATDALHAAMALQRAFHTEAWPAGTALRVRMALHTGEADLRDGDYYGPVVNRCARLRSIAHGGQTLLSQTTSELLREHLPTGTALSDQGTHRLRNLQHPERVFQLVQPDVPADFPPLRSLNARPNNLPLQLTHFIGREREQETLKGLLTATRLLTLTGVGGSGKTRLALEIAADLIENYPDGVWFVDLARLSDPDPVPPAIALVLGVKEASGISPEESLIAFLRSRSLLLLLDNCEHLLEACAQSAQTLLQSCPRLTILATSRNDLQIAGETVWSIAPLACPDPTRLPSPEALEGCEAIRLFLDRARTASPRFAFTMQNAPAIARICSRVDGLPLAIELAAAKVKILQAQEIDKRLFDLMEGTVLTAPDRHRTLQALMDWSYTLLKPQERTLFRRLAVFAGGWTLEAAEMACSGDGIEPRRILNLLLQLLRASLVVAEEQEETTRYRLLETVRVFAQERIQEADEEMDQRNRHGLYFLGLAEEAEGYLDGPEQALYLKRLEADHDNLRSALRWAVDPEIRLRLAAALWRFWFARSHLSEGRSWLENALARSRDGEPRIRGRALNGLGVLATKQSDYLQAQRLLEEAQDLFRTADDPRGQAETLSNLGNIAREQGAWEDALRHYEESLEMWERQGERRGTAAALNNLGMILRDHGNHDRADAHFARSLGIYRELGDTMRIGILLNNQGGIAYAQQRLLDARQYFQESLACFRALDNLFTVAILLYNLGELEYRLNGPEGADPLYRESLTLRHRLGDRGGSALVIGGLARVAAARGEDRLAARLFGAADAIRHQTGRSLPASDRDAYDARLTELCARMGQPAFDTEWASGAALSFEQAVTFALEPPVP